MKTKSVAYAYERKVSTTPLENGLYAFRDVVLIDGRPYSEMEGIAKEDVAEMEIDMFTKISPCHVRLYKRSFVEWYRTNDIEDPDNLEELASFHIDKPFTHMQKYGFDKNEVMLVHNFHNLYYEGKQLLPRYTKLNLAQGQLHDGNYDLEEVVHILSKRTDVEFIDMMADVPWAEEGEKPQKHMSIG